MPKIACAMIVKDDSEAKILDRCLKTVAPFVDKVFITGTKEPQIKVKKICKKYKAEWSWFPWCKDFSKARNFNWSQVPKEYKWIFWLDADDILQGGKNLRQAVEIGEANGMGAIFARYLYQVETEQGRKCEFCGKGDIVVKNIIIEHLRERLIRNDDTYEWVAPIHETLIEKVPTNKTDFQGFVVVHLASNEDLANSMYRNIEILEQNVIDNPNDPRPIYYLAKAYFDTKEPLILYDKLGEGLDSYAMELFKDYIRKSGWAEERAQCWEYIAMVHRERGEHKQAITALLEALSEDPKFTSIYIQMALTYVYAKDWAKVQVWLKAAEAIEIPKTTLVISPRDYKCLLLEAYYHLFLNTAQIEKCLQVAKALAMLAPCPMNDQRVIDMEDTVRRNNLAHMVVKLAYSLKETGQYQRLANLVEAIPGEIAMEPALVSLRNEYLPPKVWGEDEMAIFCGPGFEKWSPKNVSKGIGGSEEAVIYLSRELARLGWKVTVYADPQEEAGMYDGVSFRPYYEVNWKDEFNVFVSWRHIDIFDVPNLKTKKSYLWNHDIQNPLTYTPERVAKIDKVMFLSKWHRDNVKDLPEDKVMYTANGIDL